MAQSKVEAIQSFYSLELDINEFVFIFLGHSGILLRSKDFVISVDPGRGLNQAEIAVIEQIDLLFFTHNHWDHYSKKEALQIINQTGAHVVADVLSSKDLKASISSNMITVSKSGSTHQFGECKIVRLPGIHVGPINQYLVNFGGIKIFHGGDSGYLRHKDVSADIAFVPTGTATTCHPAVALAMIMNLQPKLAVPIHGNKQDLKQFKALMEKVLPEVEVIVPERFKPVKLSV